MITKTITLYSFDELTEKAKNRAREDYATNDGYLWADDALKSLSALAEKFGGKLVNYSITWDNSSPSRALFDMPDDMTESETADVLRTLGGYNKRTGRGNGDCVLTGYCMDEDAIDGLRAAFRAGETDLHSLMQAAFRSWLKVCQADYEDFYSDERFSEHCESNGYHFTESGKLS